MNAQDLIRFADDMLVILDGSESPAKKIIMLEKRLSEGEASMGRKDLVQGRGARGRA